MIIDFKVEEFKKIHPAEYAGIPLEVRQDLEVDPEYIIRFDTVRRCAEVGYPSDLWLLK